MPSATAHQTPLPSADPLVVVENLSVVKQGDKILDDVSFRIRPHEFITILGPNGAGKTTLLRCLIGLRTPTRGRIRKKSGLRIGYVPQLLNMNRMLRLSVEQFLFLNTRTHAANVQQAVDEVGVAPLLGKSLMHLSGGERQQVLIARALSHQPELLVLDEPTQHLDIHARTKFYQQIQTIYERKNIALLMISHDLSLVMRSNHHVICLYHHICCEGKPQAISQDPAFANLYKPATKASPAIPAHTKQPRETNFFSVDPPTTTADADDLLAVYCHKHDHTHD